MLHRFRGPGSVHAALSLVGPLFLLGITAVTPAQSERTFLYVNTDRGNDNASGSLSAPLKTLNKALEKAWDIRYDPPANPCTDPPIDSGIGVVIKVTAPTTPVAPSTHGGNELAGWQTFQDVCLGVTHPPFPIRMIEQVWIEGISTSGARPRVLIDESAGANPYTAWNIPEIPFPQRSYFHGATSAVLANLDLDGTLFHFKKSTAVNGVYMEKVSGMGISNCRINDLFDGLRFHSDDPLNGTSCTVTDCELLSLGPLIFPSSNAENQGHAGVWMTGSGRFDVSFSGTTVEGCHDAIEIAGTEQTEGRLSITNCTFHNNENGVEGGNDGSLFAAFSGCTFDSNFNLPSGMPLFNDGVPFSPAAIITRGEQCNVTVRSCTFFNNSFCLLAGSPGTYDFGVSGTDSPGMNVFDLDFGVFSSMGQPDPLRVAMYVRDPTAVVTAGGNTWYHHNLNQGTTATGCLVNPVTGPPVGAPVTGLNLVLVTLPDSSTAWMPPGPAAGIADQSGVDWKRNYSLDPGTTIDLGSDCLP